MNIFVTSDTHGRLERTVRIYRALTGEEKTMAGVPKFDGFDLIIHCGDYKSDAFKLKEMLGIDTAAVFGNCDHADGRGRYGHDIEKIPTPAGTIMVTHGDLEGVREGHTDLLYLAEQEECSLVCYGHTHIPVFESEDGIMIVNPGSPTRPLDGTLSGSCAVITANENGFDGEIIYYDDLFEDEPEKSGGSEEGSGSSKTGGFLRKIFNYSDGQ